MSDAPGRGRLRNGRKPKTRSPGRTEPAHAIPARARNIATRLAQAVPKPVVELDHENAWQLLIATILSAQSTDKLINRVTPELFRRFPRPAALGTAPEDEVEEIVRPTGFYRNKARAIRAASLAIAQRFEGEVPHTMAELIELPGVARKTANVVLSAFGVAEGIVVDTHVSRVSRRLAFSKDDDPGRIESDLMKLFPRRRWIEIGLRLLLHGRYVCTARAPKCGDCAINELCPSHETPPAKSWPERADLERRIVESRGEM